MSRQLSCRDMCKIVTWTNNYFSRKCNLDFYKIWIMSPLVKQVSEADPNVLSFIWDGFYIHVI